MTLTVPWTSCAQAPPAIATNRDSTTAMTTRFIGSLHVEMGYICAFREAKRVPWLVHANFRKDRREFRRTRLLGRIARVVLSTAVHFLRLIASRDDGWP